MTDAHPTMVCSRCRRPARPHPTGRCRECRRQAESNRRNRRLMALDRHARLVYDHDRDFPGEVSGE